MTFDQIQYFIAIAECNTYFDAAEELNNISKQISLHFQNRSYKIPIENKKNRNARKRFLATLLSAGSRWWPIRAAARRKMNWLPSPPDIRLT